MPLPFSIPSSSSFYPIFERAGVRKGGEKELLSLIPSPLNRDELAAVSEDRFLSMMTKSINQAGFSWKVIEQKWPEFEEAYFGFKVDTLLMLSDEQWEAYTKDRRVVRNWQKIKPVRENAMFILNERLDNKGIASLIADWPVTDQIGLLDYLKKNGSRLGGQTSQWLLRRMGKDCFVLSQDVVGALRTSGLDIKPKPTSKRELKLIQSQFNQWHEETKAPFTFLSKILAYSFGDNYEPS